MASPQKENGNTGIANELMEVLAKTHIPPASMSCLLVVLRETWGWTGQGNFKAVKMSNGDISRKTGLIRQNVVRAMRWLYDNNILWGIESKLILSNEVRIKNDSMRVSTIGFNKDYDTWTAPHRINTDSTPPRINTDSKTRINTDSKKAFLPLDDKKDKNNPYSPLKSKPVKKRKRKKSPKRTKEFHDHFWPTYPRKVSKGAALKSWEKLSQEGTLPPTTQIVESIEAQIKEKEELQRVGSFCPEWKHPSTWLNQLCWEDEVRSVYSSEGKKPWHI